MAQVGAWTTTGGKSVARGRRSLREPSPNEKHQPLVLVGLVIFLQGVLFGMLDLRGAAAFVAVVAGALLVAVLLVAAWRVWDWRRVER
jgi:hypothetical protein